jgi:hypothetical protein
VNWTRIIAEGTAIVLSILLAFAIDAWWDGQKNRTEERELLLGLEQEFAAYQERLEGDAARGQRFMRLLEAVLLAGPPEFRDPPPPAQADSAIFAMLFNPTFDADGGTLAALLSSGRLELIQSRGLRTGLAAWSSVVADIRDNELFRREFEMGVLTPFFVSRGIPLSRAEATRYEWPTVAIPDADADRIYSELFRDPSFVTIAAEKYATVVNGTGEYGAAAETAGNLLEQIRAHLNESSR